MPAGTPDEWLFEDWQLIARALTATMHEDCQCYKCDTIDALRGDIAHYWDLDENKLTQLLHWRRTAGSRHRYLPNQVEAGRFERRSSKSTSNPFKQ